MEPIFNVQMFTYVEYLSNIQSNFRWTTVIKLINFNCYGGLLDRATNSDSYLKYVNLRVWTITAMDAIKHIYYLFVLFIKYI